MPATLRSELLAVVLAAMCLVLLGRVAAASGTTEAWAGWTGAALMFLVLLPLVRRKLGGAAANHPSLVFAVPAAIMTIGLFGAFAAGGVTWERALLWVLSMWAAVIVTVRGTDEPEPWRLLSAAVLIGLSAGAWDRALRIAVPHGPRLGFTFFSAVALAAFLFGAARPLKTFDLKLDLSWRDLLIALTGLAVIVAAATPLGMAVDFIAWRPRSGGPLDAAARLLAYTVFVGLPEEMLFRGLIQEGLSRWRGARFGLLVGSLLFGLAHLPNGAGLSEAQRPELYGLNWRFALLAALAGVGYGWVYIRTGRLAAAALTHGAVNWIWTGFFLRA